MDLTIEVFWLLGFSVSTLCLVFQLWIYYLIPCSRKLDLKLLTQLTVARLLNVALEYVVICVPLNSAALNIVVFSLYVQTDAILICWMFVFTKNLYDSVMNVFALKVSFTLVTIIIWCVTIPIGLLCPLLFELGYQRHKKDKNTDISEYFNLYYLIYTYVKFIILTVNLLLFGVIFKIAMSRNDRVVSLVRTCVVSFLLVSIASVQVLLNDLLTNFTDEYPSVSIAFGAINSYQIILITVVFVILLQKNCQDESLTQKITKKFIRQDV